MHWAYYVFKRVVAIDVGLKTSHLMHTRVLGNNGVALAFHSYLSVMTTNLNECLGTIQQK